MTEPVGGADGARSLVRGALAFLTAAGSLACLWFAWRGDVGPGSAAAVAAFGVAATVLVPRGGRPAAWILAIWCAVTLVVLAPLAGGAAATARERLRPALGAAVIYLAVAGAGFWACLGKR
ncbi:MAG: hypothetical protein D6718_07485 [Acidobacteria bacterium]|nr:MAG: hypothetical protein D6718_07485 [Acidobacteriota bacterium]